MRIYEVTDREFVPYGQVMDGYDTAQLLEEMNRIPMPEQGTAYENSIASLEACGIFEDIKLRAFGGMPAELGMCWGWNTKLNCLEYHRDSELNVGTTDFILLLARRDEIVDGVIDSSRVKAFRVPAGVMVEVYATTLHYAPCQAAGEDGFRVAAILPRGTNGPRPVFQPRNEEDKYLTACNKWLLAHPDSPEAKSGACVGITGENIDIA